MAETNARNIENKRGKNTTNSRNNNNVIKRRNSNADVIKSVEMTEDESRKNISKARMNRRLNRLNSEPLSQTKHSVSNDTHKEEQERQDLSQTCPIVHMSSDVDKQSNVTSRRRSSYDFSTSGNNCLQRRQSEPSSSFLQSSDFVTSQIQGVVETGSDTVPEVCDICESQDSICGYCENCKQYLCKGCREKHRKINTTKTHTVVCVDNAASDLSDVRCYQNGESRSVYRKDVETFNSLSSYSAGRDLRDALKQLSGARKEILSQFDSLEAEKSTILNEIHKFRNNLVQHIDSLVYNAIGGTNSKYLSAFEKITTEKKNIECYIQELTRLCQNIENPKVRHGKSQDQVAELVGKAKERCKEISADTLSLQETLCKMNLHFSPNPKLRALNDSVTSLGEIEIVEERHFDRTIASIDSEFSSWVSGDLMETTCIAGIACLQNGAMVIADSYNQALKVFDSNFVHQSSVKLATSPWCLAVTSDNKVIVTLPEVKQACQFSINNNLLKKELTMETEGECLGVVDVVNEIIISCYDGDTAELVAINKQGGISRKSSHHATDKNCLLKRPNYLQINRDCSVLYVSDADMGLYGINVLDLQTVIFRYRPPNLLCPLGVAVDNCGNIYVCGGQSHNIHQLTRSADPHRLVTTKRQTHSPQCISFCAHTNALFVSLDKEYDIKVLQLCWHFACWVKISANDILKHFSYFS